MAGEGGRPEPGKRDELRTQQGLQLSSLQRRTGDRRVQTLPVQSFLDPQLGLPGQVVKKLLCFKKNRVCV